VGLLVSLGFFIGQFLALASTQCNCVEPFWVFFLFFIFIYIHFYLSKKKKKLCLFRESNYYYYFLFGVHGVEREGSGWEFNYDCVKSLLSTS
jgi:hypothetical protein